MNEEGIRCKYHGINIYIIPDRKLDIIILPESLVKYIPKLQVDNEKYKKEKQNE